MYSNTTPNYNLPQYVGTDHIDPVADFNPSFLKIDEALKVNADDNLATKQIANTTKETADNAILKSDKASADVSALMIEVASLKEMVQGLQTTITELGIDTLSADVAKLKADVVILENRVEPVSITSADYELLTEEEKTDVKKWYGIIG